MKFEFSKWFKAGHKKSAKYRVLKGEIIDGVYKTTVEVTNDKKESMIVQFDSRAFSEFVDAILVWIKTWPTR